MKRLLLTLILPFLFLSALPAWSQTCSSPLFNQINIEDGTSALIQWSTFNGSSSEIAVFPGGSPAPTAGFVGTIASSPYTHSGLTCGASYDFYVRAVCPDSTVTEWEGPFNFIAMENNVLSPMIQGDTNNDGVVIFDLTTVEAQLNTTNSLTYYTSLADATNQVNPISNVMAYSLSINSTGNFIVIRENIPGGCDKLHTFAILAMSSTNIASTCAYANSLCSTIGVPYLNTVNGPAAEPGQYGCLGSQPNPTWFYIPISEAGSLNLQISQTSMAGNGLDVDFIAFGPFSAPTCGVTNLNASTEIACSYSTAFIENFTITNAQVGEYYMLLVTNFSNQAGTITISESGGSNAGIDCTGIRMTAFLDSNTNGTMEVNEQVFPLGEFNYEVNNDGIVHNVTAPLGAHSIYEINPLNLYEISYSINSIYGANYVVNPSSFSNVTVVPGGGLQNYYFPVTAILDYADLSVTIVPMNAPQPGFSYVNKVLYSNYGSQPIAAGTITFTNDPTTPITSITPAGIMTTPTGFSHDFTDLMPFESREILVNMSVPVIPIVALGDVLTSTASGGVLAGDVFPENNDSEVTQIIVGSYDPNDKAESRGGDITITDFGPEDYLYYTIRFENSGTANAINIRVLDVLDDSLDASSVRMVGASHEYSLDRVNNSLTWNFSNVQLPPTTIDPVLSHGYIHFKVKPNPGYAVGDIIPNAASIFFDFNPAIVTNTFYTEFVAPLAVEQYESGQFVIYPNPACNEINISMSENNFISTVTVYDTMGKAILSTSVNGDAASHSLNISALSTGLYFIEVMSTNSSRTIQKLLIQ